MVFYQTITGDCNENNIYKNIRNERSKYNSFF